MSLEFFFCPKPHSRWLFVLTAFAAKPHHSTIHITQSYTIGRAVDCYFLLHSPNNLSLSFVAFSISSLTNWLVIGARFLRFNCFCLLSIYSPNICLRNSCSAMVNVIILSALGRQPWWGNAPPYLQLVFLIFPKLVNCCVYCLR